MTLVSLDPAGPARPGASLLDMQQTAARVGLSWERFRKVRLGWTRDRDFPAEINEPGEPVRYVAAAVDAWLARRTLRVHRPRLLAGGAPDAPAAMAPDALAHPVAHTLPAADRALGRRGREGLKRLKEA